MYKNMWEHLYYIACFSAIVAIGVRVVRLHTHPVIGWSQITIGLLGLAIWLYVFFYKQFSKGNTSCQ